VCRFLPPGQRAARSCRNRPRDFSPQSPPHRRLKCLASVHVLNPLVILTPCRSHRSRSFRWLSHPAAAPAWQLVPPGRACQLLVLRSGAVSLCAPRPRPLVRTGHDSPRNRMQRSRALAKARDPHWGRRAAHCSLLRAYIWIESRHQLFRGRLQLFVPCAPVQRAAHAAHDTPHCGAARSDAANKSTALPAGASLAPPATALSASRRQ
jgi:hypothetical protein